MTTDHRLLVIGAGSIGARHARNLVALGAEVDVMDVDADRAAAIDGARPRPMNLDALDDYDGVVVASPTSVHALHAHAVLGTTSKVLVEKPLAMTAGDANALAELGADRLGVGYNLRFHAPTQDAMRIVRSGELGRISSIRLWFGHWLPDWRPTQDYRQTYSAREDMGGGVLLDAIHEIDLLLWMLPEADLRVTGAVVDRLGPLEIDVEDTVKALMRCQRTGTTVELSLDYLARRYRRGFEVTGELGTLRLDWSRGILEIEDSETLKGQPADAPVSDSYVRQAKAFLSWVAGGPPLPVDGHEGARSVVLADDLRRAANR